ncbi:phosphatase PAP2 family protein [Pedobacter sandarakinus]|uniref:phosphatase PAP2 family protein n=1 Tax=Pedobacter sandarakinus TaxID=353156 RepID=UPI00224815F9|nr:phosphatase PAP2 family protein [Pedobacter sandarakinus]MCX2575195.1 phosphatase PAP2 family protein [Pedobacter sandarakinus]
MRKSLIFIVAINLIFTNGYAQRQELINSTPIDSNSQLQDEFVKSRKFGVASFVIPTVFIGYGFFALSNKGFAKELDLSTKAELQEDHPLFAAHVDDYLQFSPAVAVYALQLSGLKGEHNIFDSSILYATSAIVMGISTHIVKQAAGRNRPDDSGTNSFPSGHTASAFMAAEFLHQEYKNVSPFISYAGYFVATSTGALRMYNNKHWLSDVIAGAGFGIASTKIAYLVYPYVRQLFHNKAAKNVTFMPYHAQSLNGLFLSMRF